MKKDFDRWNEKKKKLEERYFADYVKEREVWWCAIGVNLGVESSGKEPKFERPILVLRKFSRDAVLVIPLTSQIKRQNSYHVVHAHAGREFAAVISQVRLVSTKRLLRKIYRMDSAVFGTIRSAFIEMTKNDRPPLARGPRRPHGH